jgi:hypothetical protein
MQSGSVNVDVLPYLEDKMKMKPCSLKLEPVAVCRSLLSYAQDDKTKREMAKYVELKI